MSAPIPPSPEDIPDVMKAFIAQASPPYGQGNDYFVLNWKVALTLLFYIPYAAILWKHSSVPWILLAYSIAAVVFFAMAIRGFKKHMAYQSNPFDFVRVQFLLLLNVIVLFGLAHWTLSTAEPAQYSKALDVFDGIYYSVVTMATLGYGDIYPAHHSAQSLAIFEVFFGIWFFVTVVPVAVADQAERIRHYRAGRKEFAEAMQRAWERGEMRVVDAQKDPEASQETPPK
jgi:voltage-gated potassium channel